MRGCLNNTLSGSVGRSDFLLASRLVALEKPNGGVRPIAMGVALVQLVSICALACVPDVVALLTPLQVNVGIRGGAEIPGHALRPDFLKAVVVTVSIALRNAFNVGDRDLALTITVDLLLELYPV